MPKATKKVSKTTAKELGRREQRRVQHQDMSRTQLLDAAEEVFGRKGFHEATLKEVADLAEYSVGSVYSFFENKDDLFRQIFLRRGDEFMTGLRAQFEDETQTPMEQLHNLIDFECGFFREHRHFGRLFLRYSSATALGPNREIDDVIAANYEEAMDLQAKLIARGQETGQFRGGDAESLARLFSGLVAAYQSVDPAVVTDDPHPGERLPLTELHDLVENAFAAPTSLGRQAARG